MKRIRWMALPSSLLLALSIPACKKSGGGDQDTSLDTEQDSEPDVTIDTSEDTVPDVDEEEAIDPCWLYPCGPYGWELGNVVSDLTFQPGNAASSTIAGTDGVFSLSDLYQQNVEHGGTLTGVLLWLTTGWCPYCRDEAPDLQGLYDELLGSGILIVGVVSQNDAGDPADPAFANAYATRSGWTTLPSVAGDLDDMAYPPADRAEPGVPLHFFLDLVNMRIYGRYTGATEMKIPRYVLQDIAAGPEWGPAGERILDFDCAPGTGNEVEPNGLADTPHDGTPLPVTLSGVQCPLQVGDGLFLDEDTIDLGNLTDGTAIQVTMSTTSADVYPFFELARVAGTSVDALLGPFLYDADSARRQWVIHQDGHYYIAGVDGRNQTSAWYTGGSVPIADQCCDGGPGFTYDLLVEPFTLAATEADLSIGSVTGTMDNGDINVYPFAATSGTSYSFTMTADDTDFLDPYLILYDPATSSVLAHNDDISTSGGNYNSRILWSATADATVWVVACYWGAWYRLGAPGYTLLVE